MACNFSKGKFLINQRKSGNYTDKYNSRDLGKNIGGHHQFMVNMFLTFSYNFQVCIEK